MAKHSIAPGRRASRVYVCLGAALVLPAATAVFAADWQINPRIEVSGVYDDNYRLDISDANQIEVSGAEATARFEFLGQTPRSEISIIPSLRGSLFSESEENSDGEALAFKVTNRGLKSQRRFFADFSREDTIKTDRPGVVGEDPDLGEPDGGDSGRLNVHNIRELISVRPEIDFDISQRSKLQLGGRYRDVSFDKDVSGQIGFSDVGGNIGWQTATSPRSTFTLRARGSRYEPDIVTNATDSTTYGVELEWARKMSEATEYYLRGGGQRTDLSRLATDPRGDTSENTYIAGAGGRWAFLVTKLFLDATIGVDPNSSGVLVRRDQIRFNVERQLSPKMTALAGARVMRDEPIDDQLNAAAERRYGVATVGFEWRLRREYSFAANYEFTRQEFRRDIAQGEANSNGIRLSVVYEPGKKD